MSISSANVTRTWTTDHKGLRLSMHVAIGEDILATEHTVSTALMVRCYHPEGQDIERRMQREILHALERALFP